MTAEPRAPRRRGKPWVRLARGVHRSADVTGDLVTADLAAWQEQLPPTAVFTHLTAARQHRLWLPPLPADLPVFVAIPTATPRPRRPELVLTRHPDPPASVDVEGVRVAPVAETLLACARDLGVVDLVVLIDSALHGRVATAGEIAAVARPRRRGAPRLRAALALADAHSESPWESVLRLFHVAVEAPVVPQYVIAASNGRFVARADLLLAGTRTIHEYDGAGHRDARQHRADLRRDREVIAAGYVRRGYTADDLRRRADDLLRDVDTALERQHDPTRLDRWEAWWNASLFSPVGTRALEQSWGLRGSEPGGGVDQLQQDPRELGVIEIW